MPGRPARSDKALMNIEYLTVLILFMIFSFYFTFKLLEQKPAYVREVRKEIFRSENYMISQVLINDPGEPDDWASYVGIDEGMIKRVGLLNTAKNDTNYLNATKVVGLRNLCSGGGYGKVAARLGAFHNFSISFTDSSGSTGDFTCGPTTSGEVMSSVKRIVAIDNGGYGYIFIESW